MSAPPTDEERERLNWPGAFVCPPPGAPRRTISRRLPDEHEASQRLLVYELSCGHVVRRRRYAPGARIVCPSCPVEARR